MNITDKNFEEQLNVTDKFVLVDFFATWCGPCQVLGPILEKVAEQFKDQLILHKIDVDQFPITSQKYNIEKIPTIFLFKNGKPVGNFSGLVPEDTIKNWIENAIKQNS